MRRAGRRSRRTTSRRVLGEALRKVRFNRCSGFLVGLRFAREAVVGIVQAGLEIANNRAEKARPQGARGILADGRQLSQGGSGRRGHTAKLPADLLADSIRPAREVVRILVEL